MRAGGQNPSASRDTAGNMVSEDFLLWEFNNSATQDAWRFCHLFFWLEVDPLGHHSAWWYNVVKTIISTPFLMVYTTHKNGDFGDG